MTIRFEALVFSAIRAEVFNFANEWERRETKSRKANGELRQKPSEIKRLKTEITNYLDSAKKNFARKVWMQKHQPGTEQRVWNFAETEIRIDLEVLLEQGRSYLLG